MMSRFVIIALFVCFISYANVDGYKVLGLFPGPSYSHYTLGAVLMNKLVDNGHDVTMMHTMKRTPRDKFKSIDLSGMMEMKKEETNKKEMNFFERTTNPIENILMIHGLGNRLTEMVLQNPETKKLIESKEHYDVIIIEHFVNDALKGFCSHFKAPCIVVNSVRSLYWSNIPMGNPSNPSYIVDSLNNHAGPMDFCRRLLNAFYSVVAQAHYHLSFIPHQNTLMQKYFPNAPHINEVLYNTSLMFLNSDVASGQPVPLLPNMIEIGGYHVQPAKKLPADWQTYLDGCKNGVVYFSMGSNLKGRQIPAKQKASILKVLGKLKQNVLWKFEKDFPGTPANVRIEKWFPQEDILAHPNVKLFITHGGLLSTIESIYHGVPVLGLPIYGDQDMNMLQAQNNGFGIKESFRTLTEESFSGALNEILNNPKYTENAKKYSNLMHDQPMKPLDRAAFWVDYVVRHKGAAHFRSAALDLKWYQYYLLDVFALIVSVLLISITVLVCLVKRIFKKKNCCPTQKPGVSKKPKAKQN